MVALIIGGTGTTGSRLASLLPDARVGTRKPVRPGQVRFDWDVLTTFERALEGIDRLYLIPRSASSIPRRWSSRCSLERGSCGEWYC